MLAAGGRCVVIKLTTTADKAATTAETVAKLGFLSAGAWAPQIKLENGCPHARAAPNRAVSGRPRPPWPPNGKLS